MEELDEKGKHESAFMRWEWRAWKWESFAGQLNSKLFFKNFSSLWGHGCEKKKDR